MPCLTNGKDLSVIRLLPFCRSPLPTCVRVTFLRRGRLTTNGFGAITNNQETLDLAPERLI